MIRYVPFLGLELLPDYLAIPLTVFALVGVTNAINLADGLDGLAGGITLLSLGIVAILAYTTADVSLVLATVAVIGSIVGFLRFNTYPARIWEMAAATGVFGRIGRHVDAGRQHRA